MNFLRVLVSKRKTRTVDRLVPHGPVDLDLVEIHPRIVCMGYPASGIESLYRNRYKDVLRYLDYKYGSSYIVYNLCAEKAYQYSPEHFHGRVKLFPFLDHQACPLQLIPAFVSDAAAHLARHHDNIVVIHCKAGKGRTGILACCLLMQLEPHLYPTAEEAIKFYGLVRTSNGRGLTVPSQRRYVHYYETLLRHHEGQIPHAVTAVRWHAIKLVNFPPSLRLRRLSITINNSTYAVNLSITRSQHKENVNGCSAQDKYGGNRKDAEDMASTLIVDCTENSKLQFICGDVRVELHSATQLVGALSFHTLFMQSHYAAAEIDKLCRRSCCTDACGVDFVFDKSIIVR